MKKITLTICTAVTLFAVSCNNEAKGPSEADINAMVDKKVEAATAQLKTNCDNSIMQAAQAKADSAIAKMAKPKVQAAPAPVVATPVAKPATAPKVVKAPPVKKVVVPEPVRTKPKDVNDRVGGNGKENKTLPKNVNDRTGGNDVKENKTLPKNVNDRPGGNK